MKINKFIKRNKYALLLALTVILLDCAFYLTVPRVLNEKRYIQEVEHDVLTECVVADVCGPTAVIEDSTGKLWSYNCASTLPDVGEKVTIIVASSTADNALDEETVCCVLLNR